MTLDPTKPEDQIKLMIGELLITIAQLEAQKAALQAECAALKAARVTPPAPEGP